MEKYIQKLNTVPPEYIKDFVNEHIVYLVACSIGFLFCTIFSIFCIKLALKSDDTSDPGPFLGVLFSSVLALSLLFTIACNVVAVVSPLLVIKQ